MGCFEYNFDCSVDYGNWLGEAMNDYAISLKNFSLLSSSPSDSTADGTVLLDNVSFGFAWGSMTLLYGESGCGKTSLLNCFTGLARSSTHLKLSGSLTVDGEDAHAWSPDQASAHVSCVLQNPDAHIIHGRVDDEIAFSCENQAESAEVIDKKVRELCALLHLDPQADTSTLSGGEKERLCIASVLACDKKIIIVDEPLASLDVQGAQIVLTVLRSLADRGYCVIICEHRISTVADYVDTAFAMGGATVREISPIALKTQVAEFMTSYDEVLQSAQNNAQSTQPVLASVRDVQVHTASGRTILNIDSLELHEREVVLLVGDNGSGKTTLLNVLAGVQGLRKPAQRHISADVLTGLVWQSPQYQIFSTSVANEVALRTDNQEVRERELTALGLCNLTERHPLTLSEGQKRRLICAATWAAEPDIVLMDEPFAGQDSANIERQLARIQRLIDEHNSCIVLSTHDVRGVMDMVTRVIYLEQGRIARDTRTN